MLVPGALISTQLPMFVYDAFESFTSVAPTVIAFIAEEGDFVHASTRSLPAATTTVIPALTKRSIASLRASDFGPPILKLRTACVFGFGFPTGYLTMRRTVIN